MSKRTKKHIVFGSGIVFVLLTISLYSGYHYFIKKQCDISKYSTFPAFTENDLSKYDGVNDEKVYVGYHCLVYDVTEGKDMYYGEGKGYHYLVGRDSSKQLEIFGGDIIETKYPIVGVLQE